jgi:hypothetical protein
VHRQQARGFRRAGLEGRLGDPLAVALQSRDRLEIDWAGLRQPDPGRRAHQVRIDGFQMARGLQENVVCDFRRLPQVAA